MEKLIKIDVFDSNGEPNVKVIDTDPYELSKFAYLDNYPRELRQFIANITPDPGLMYLLVNAVGAYEYYGSNLNGDAFPEKSLLEVQSIDETRDGNPPVPRYKTFELYAKVFRHHQKQNRENNYGDVVKSVYDHKMHRVLLVIRVIKDRARDIVERIQEGYVISVSMGCKVPFDICSICGHMSKTRAEYCDHLKNHMNEITPDGKLICALNTKPRFDDISFVLLPAWKVGRVLTKVAHKETIPIKKYASPIFKYGLLRKSSDIDKEVPGEVIENIIKLKLIEPEIPQNDIDFISRYPLRKVLASFFIMGMQPKPTELQSIILNKVNDPDITRYMNDNDFMFNENYRHIEPMDFGPNDVDYNICRVLYDYIPSRSIFGKHLEYRLSKTSQQNVYIPPVELPSPVQNSILPLAAFFAGAMSIFKSKGLDLNKYFPKFVKANIWFIPAILGGAALVNAMENEPPSRRYWPNVPIEKTSGLGSLLHTTFHTAGSMARYGIKHPSFLIGTTALPAAYLGSGYLMAREQQGYNTNPLLKIVKRHPAITGSLIAAPSLLHYVKSVLH